MSKIQLSQRMYSVRDIDRLIETGEMSIQPKYQRRRTAWPLSAKSALIDTMLNNYPIPPVYLRDYVDPTNKRLKEIIDGQQRVSTIVEFFRGEFALSRNLSDSDLTGLKYSELPSREKQLVEDFEVSFIAIRGASDGDIISIFSRLNSYSLPLNSQEKRNSQYAGDLKSFVYELATEYNTFWIDNKILSEAQIARMYDALLVSDILYTVLNGYQSSSSSSLDKMYSAFDDAFTHKSSINTKFNKTFTILGHLFESRYIQSSFKSKFMFYTLFLAVYAKAFGFTGREGDCTRNVNIEKTYDKLEEFAFAFNSPVYDASKKAKIKQATGNKLQREFRHSVIAKLIK